MLERMGKISLYPLQEKILKKIFKKYHKNTDVNGSKVKAETLNLYYSTEVRAIDKMVQHIKRLKIDKKLQQGYLYQIKKRPKMFLFVFHEILQFS